MKIIADCGATKSEWRVLHSDGSVSNLTAMGINASAMSAESIIRIISDIKEQISATDTSDAEIYLYTAGLPSEELKADITAVFNQGFKVSSIEFHSDLTAAARAVCGHKPGIAGILGTGSNSCQYDGEKIVKQIYSGGFIIGDEGSAATLGRLFISDFIKGLVRSEVAEDFKSHFPSDYSSIVASIYKSAGSPSGYLGSLAPFIMEHYGHPYIKELVDGNFRSFFRRCIKQYDTDTNIIGIVGGFGYALQEVVRAVAAEEEIRISRFIKAPIDDLVNYHR
jgi:N-acetylglucosamine kinase-like BadF-type ATPase